ncbi:patatin-like phospholipase family protein [Streptomyces sp. NPDC054794]
MVRDAWPPAFVCTGTDIDSGRLQVWDEHASVALARAVAASCSVPFVFPVIGIDGRRCIDGGLRDPLNADLARGHETVIAVSCFPLTAEDPGPIHPAALAQQRTTNAVLRELRDQDARIAIVEPDEEFLAIGAGGERLMDMLRVGEAYLAGARLGARAARGIAAFRG